VCGVGCRVCVVAVKVLPACSAPRACSAVQKTTTMARNNQRSKRLTSQWRVRRNASIRHHTAVSPARVGVNRAGCVVVARSAPTVNRLATAIMAQRRSRNQAMSLLRSAGTTGRRCCICLQNCIRAQAAHTEDQPRSLIVPSSWSGAVGVGR